MSSRDRLSRLDLDTAWPYHHKTKLLQARFRESWPAYWCAYLGLLAEAWAIGDRRLTLADAWIWSLPVDVDDAAEALRSVGLLDRFNRIPAGSWRVWYEPVQARMSQYSAAGRAGAAARWRGNGAVNGDANAAPDAIAMHHTNRTNKAIPTKPARDSLSSKSTPRARPREERGSAAGPTKAEASRAWSELKPKLAAMAAGADAGKK